MHFAIFDSNESTKPENPNPLSMEHLSNICLHQTQQQQDHSLEFHLQNLLPFDTSTNIPHMGFNPFNHLYQPEFLQDHTYNTFQSFTSMAYDYDPFSHFHIAGFGHGFSEEIVYNNGLMEYLEWEMGCKGKKGGNSKSKSIEKLRRQDFNNKYNALLKLLPNRTKNDKASVLGGAIEYVKELLQTVKHLKLVLHKKRRLIERTKKLKTEHDAAENNDGSDPNLSDEQNEFCNGSWLQRKSKDTEVDVHVINDEVTIKLVQQKKSDCLVCVSKILDELHLDVHHVAGGCLGDFNSFMFNTKIYEGASVHASVIANKLIAGLVTDNAYSTPPLVPVNL